MSRSEQPIDDDVGLVPRHSLVEGPSMAAHEGVAYDTVLVAAVTTSIGIAVFSPAGEIIDVNDMFAAAVGYDRVDLIGRHQSFLCPPAVTQDSDYVELWTQLAAGHPRTGEFKTVGRFGAEVWLRGTYCPVRDRSNEHVTHIVEFALDVTAEKRRSADHESRLQAIRRSEMVAEFSLDGIFQEANDRFMACFEYDEADLVGRHHRVLCPDRYVASRDYEQFWEELRRGVFHAGRFQRFTKSGREVWIQATYNPVFDADGVVRSVMKLAHEVTKEVTLEREVRYQAEHDAVTGLLNREGLRERLAHLALVASRAPLRLAALFVDLDGFKTFNDSYGHLAGDLLLEAIGRAVVEAVRPVDLAARFGGDEFVIVTELRDTDAARVLGARVLQAVERTTVNVDSPAGRAGVSASIGVALGVVDEFSEVLREADRALYRAKRLGGARVMAAADSPADDAPADPDHAL